MKKVIFRFFRCIGVDVPNNNNNNNNLTQDQVQISMHRLLDSINNGLLNDVINANNYISMVPGEGPMFII